jgi:hypothetical protein
VAGVAGPGALDRPGGGGRGGWGTADRDGLSRFVQAQNGYDLITGGFPGNVDPARALARIEALPEVAQWARIDVAAATAILPSGRVASAPELMATTDLRDGRVSG